MVGGSRPNNNAMPCSGAVPVRSHLRVLKLPKYFTMFLWFKVFRRSISPMTL